MLALFLWVIAATAAVYGVIWMIGTAIGKLATRKQHFYRDYRAGQTDMRLENIMRNGIRMSDCRCPYCGSYDSDGMSFCNNCDGFGDDLDDSMDDY